MLNKIGDETIEALIALESSAFDFRLNGSRFFGTNNITSDWDFFCGDNEDIEEYLTLVGFKPIPVFDKGTGDGYDDGYTNRRLKAPDHFPKVAADRSRQDVVKVYRRGRVDVQMVVDPLIRTKLITWIKDNMPIYREIRKERHKVLYNFFFDIIYDNVSGKQFTYASQVREFLLPFNRNSITQFVNFVLEFRKKKPVSAAERLDQVINSAIEQDDEFDYDDYSPPPPPRPGPRPDRQRVVDDEDDSFAEAVRTMAAREPLGDIPF